MPSLDVDIHLVLCDFGRSGFAYVETDPTEADATTVVRNLLHGQYDRPIRRHAFIEAHVGRVIQPTNASALVKGPEPAFRNLNRTIGGVSA
jgi:hypothetical protein